MTAKEKAKELVEKMYVVHSHSASDITYYFVKECALIAVDEIINNYEENINIVILKYFGKKLNKK